MTELVAVLVGEPYSLSIDQIRKLTFYQISNVYFRARDDRGAIVRDPPKEAPLSAEDRFRETWRKRGLPDWRITELLAKLRAEAEKKKE